MTAIMGDNLQSLRRLAKRFNIRERRNGEGWPEAHMTTFQSIKSVSQYRFDTYIPEFSVFSSEKPWKQQTKARAQWLVERASRLMGQDRNEAGWRFALENEVLRRLTVEVACHLLFGLYFASGALLESFSLMAQSPNCRAKVWESEIPATWYNDNDEYGQRLEERRKQRVSCQCSPDQRPKDFYDLGTNRLFEDRVGEFVVYDDLVKSNIPKQGPDRVFGLLNTTSFQSLLDSPARPDIQTRPDDTISDLIKSTPFKTETDPLLFPFLVLEAKSESSSRGFDAILTQTFFPIRALLKLQDDLRLYVPEGEPAFEPLVWFLASRGDAWRLYCGTVVKGENGDPTKYETTFLWHGTLLDHDSSLQLVLIVDYIMDWARDIYRIAILRQLKSMVTGRSLDQITLAYSEMSSMRRDVSRWIPAPPSTVLGELETASESDGRDTDSSSVPLSHQDLLDIQIPNTKLGSLRSASRLDRQFNCLYLTEGLLPSFLEVISGPRDSEDKTEKAARQIINFVTQFDDILVMQKRDIDMIESLWTGKEAASDPDEDLQEYYVVMEASSYFKSSWELTKEFSCLAITKPAFNALQTHAAFRVRHKGIESLSQCERRCPRGVILHCLECLQSGSPWQTLLSAISCTVVVIYPLPTRRRDDFIPPVDVLGFGYVKYSQVRSFVAKFLGKNLWKPKDIEKVRVKSSEMSHYLSLGYTTRQILEMKTVKRPKHTDTAWKRISQQTTVILEGDTHIREKCKRCTLSPESNISPYTHGFLDTRNVPSLPDYNAILVVSLHEHGYRHREYKADACVFALGRMQEVAENIGFPDMIENMLQFGLVYHTVFSATNNTSPGLKFGVNLSLPYRSVTSGERYRLENWIKELRGKPLSDRSQSILSSSFEEEVTYKLMYLLSIGHPEEEATVLSNIHNLNLESAIYEEKSLGEPFPFRKIKLRGEITAQRFTSWDEGKEFLRREHPKHVARMKSISGGQRNTNTQQDSLRTGLSNSLRNPVPFTPFMSCDDLSFE